MTISIQLLDYNGQPKDAPIVDTLSRFLTNNDGFSIQEAARMREILVMGSGYLLGGGAAPTYRIKMVGES